MARSEEPTRQKLRLPFLDGLRGLAALAVVFIHVFYEPSLGAYSHRWMYWFGVSYHRVPVDIFIVLSGFCLMLPIAQRGQAVSSWREWFTRRALRILPPYYAAVVVSLLLSVFLINPWAHRIGSYIASSVPPSALWVYALELQDIFTGQMQSIHNPPLWSIAVECRVYLFMPLILWTMRSSGILPALLWTTALGVSVDRVFGSVLGAASPWYLALFTMGASAAHCCVNGTVKPWWRAASIGCVVLFGALIAAKKAAFYQAHPEAFSLLVGAGTSFYVGASAWDVMNGTPARLARVLSSRPLVAVGTFSYSIYLIHNPVIRVSHLALESLARLSPELMFAALLAGTPLYLLVAYLFHVAVERPFMSAAPRQLASPEVQPL